MQSSTALHLLLQCSVQECFYTLYIMFIKKKTYLVHLSTYLCCSYYNIDIIFFFCSLPFSGQQSSASGLSLPQMQGSIFGAQSNQQQQQSQQPQFNFGSATQATQPPPPSFNFSAGSGGLGGMGSTPNPTPQLGFPPSNAGGLNFAAAPPSMTGSQGTGLGTGIGQNSATSSSADNSNNNKQLQQGFQFNPNAGVNFNFGVGQGGGMAPMGSGDTSNLLFSAGSAQASSSTSSSRVIKKARRRKT